MVKLNRQSEDWYVEPPECVEKLIEVEQYFGNSILDPCCGKGNIPTVFHKAGYQNIECHDLVNRGIEIPSLQATFKQQDFITSPKDKKWDVIVTNPPFKDAVPIIQEALKVTTCKVCALLRLAFLESDRRTDFFKQSPLARVWVIKKRLTMYPGDYQGKKNTGTLAYAWFVFEHGYNYRPQLGWI